jgi:hypothetical protein
VQQVLRSRTTAQDVAGQDRVELVLGVIAVDQHQTMPGQRLGDLDLACEDGAVDQSQDWQISKAGKDIGFHIGVTVANAHEHIYSGLQRLIARAFEGQGHPGIRDGFVGHKDNGGLAARGDALPASYELIPQSLGGLDDPLSRFICEPATLATTEHERHGCL